MYGKRILNSSRVRKIQGSFSWSDHFFITGGFLRDLSAVEILLYFFLIQQHCCLKWKLNDESCFNYWGKVGTDYNVCMKVCPWSHARTFPHRMIVWLISRNWITRRIFSILDDIFYGRKPKPKVAPRWASYGNPGNSSQAWHKVMPKLK